MGFYFLARGECEVRVRDSLSKADKMVAILKAGCHFGEVALLTSYPRTATVRALNYCTVASLPKDDFIAMTKKFPHTIVVLRKGMEKYNDR